MQTQKHQIETGTFDQCKHRMDSSCHSADVTKKRKSPGSRRMCRMCMHVPVSVSTIRCHLRTRSKLRRDGTPVADLVVFFTPGETCIDGTASGSTHWERHDVSRLASQLAGVIATRCNCHRILSQTKKRQKTEAPRCRYFWRVTISIQPSGFSFSLQGKKRSWASHGLLEKVEQISISISFCLLKCVQLNTASLPQRHGLP